ncbi:hypothetical protein N9L47_13735, partial [Rhodobacteraceae bacterium]|nr:hypothetical protein [Paracoccaceae bacterium]
MKESSLGSACSLGSQQLVDAVVFEVAGEFSASWPSGRGKEVGSVYGSAKSISGRLKQPFIFSQGHLFALISLNKFGICMLHTEAGAGGFLPNTLSDFPRKFFETECFYSLFVDQANAAKSIPIDELQGLIGESRID